MKLPMLAQDKANHFIYGSVIGLIALFITSFFTLSAYTLYIPTAAAVLMGVAKEGLDLYMNKTQDKASHSVDVLDAVYTVFGGVLISLTILIT